MKATYIFEVRPDIGHPDKIVKVTRASRATAYEYVQRKHPLHFVELQTIEQ